MSTRRRVDLSSAWIYLAGAVMLAAAAAVRWLADPGLWLDESYIALNIARRTTTELFAPLEFAQWFPRLYLAAIDGLVSVVGYSTLVLRFLPLLAYLLSVVGALLVFRRLAGGSRVLALLAVALIFAADLWFLQAVSLKQYSLDVLLALIPFLVPERIYRRLLSGEAWGGAALLLLPVLFSYPYPMALAGRMAGALAHHLRDARPLRLKGLAIFSGLSAAVLALMWGIDLRFNIQVRGVVDDFWAECVLGKQLAHPGALAHTVGRLLFGWYDDPLPTLLAAGLALLFVVGCGAVAVRLFRPAPPEPEGTPTEQRDSVAAGAVAALGCLLAASLVAGYPICRGRLTLPALLSIQMLTLVGGAVLWRRARSIPWLAWVGRGTALALALFSLLALDEVRTSPPPEDLRPLLAALRGESVVGEAIFVHDCTIRQWQSLPEAGEFHATFLDAGPEENLSRLRVPGGGLLVWTHLEGPCRARLSALQEQALHWDELYSARAAGLARVVYPRARSNAQ